MANPEVRINFSWLLYEKESALLHRFLAKRGEKLIELPRAAELVREYRYAWSQIEDRVFPAMQSIFGLKFYKHVIDVSIAPWFRPQSDPLIIGTNYDADLFADILTHELLHVLLTDNNVLRVRDGEDNDVLLRRWQHLFGEEHSLGTITHIPVHAALKHLYKDILADEYRLERDINSAPKTNPDYIASWDYVEGHDYKKIIKQVQASYR